MGLIDLKVSLGTVNFTDWIHVSAAKVTNPAVPVFDLWIDAPVTNYNFIIPQLDPQNYIISYYDAPTNVALGQLRMQLIVNALTNQYIAVRRFYVCGGAGVGDPADGSLLITDPYFVNKAITGIFKENNRYLIPFTEWDTTSTFITTAGDTISNLTSVAYSAGEVIAVEILLASGVIAAPGGSIYAGRVDVTDAVYTCLTGDKKKRHRLIGTDATQVITLPSIASLSQEDFYLFDNSVGGAPVQVLLLPDGTDAILFDGFNPMDNSGDNNLHEFWVGRGEKVLLAVVDDHWECVLPYIGVNVGERFAATTLDMPNTVMEDGQIGADCLDGDVLPRLWWWLDNKHDPSYVIVDDTVINTSYVHPVGKEGWFVKHSSLKKFRTPNWQDMSEKGLKDFNSFGAIADPTRPFNWPGGKQNQAIMNHRHFIVANYSASSLGFPAGASVGYQNDVGSAGDFKYTFVAKIMEPTLGLSGKPIDDLGAANGGVKNIVDNGGVIYVRRI